jgi:hypothetical protein
MILRAVKTFKMNYKVELGDAVEDIEVKETNAIDSFNALTDCMAKRFPRKVID